MIGGAFAIAVLLIVAALHLFWALGGKLGQTAAVPERDGKPAFKPGPLATFAVAVMLVIAAALIAGRLGWITLPLPATVVRVLVWLIALVFAARAVGDFRYVGFFKRVTGSPFARLDTRVYAPLCLLLALAVADAAFEDAA